MRHGLTRGGGCARGAGRARCSYTSDARAAASATQAYATAPHLLACSECSAGCHVLFSLFVFFWAPFRKLSGAMPLHPPRDWAPRVSRHDIAQRGPHALRYRGARRGPGALLPLAVLSLAVAPACLCLPVDTLRRAPAAALHGRECGQRRSAPEPRLQSVFAPSTLRLKGGGRCPAASAPLCADLCARICPPLTSACNVCAQMGSPGRRPTPST